MHLQTLDVSLFSDTVQSFRQFEIAIALSYSLPTDMTLSPSGVNR